MNQIPIIQALSLRDRLKRKPEAHKGDAGSVLLIGGDKGMSGSLLLAGMASLHAGAGKTILAMLDIDSAHVAQNQPELMIYFAGDLNIDEFLSKINPDIIAIGPGLGKSSLAKNWLNQVLDSQIPLILDADALNLIAESKDLLTSLQKRSAESVITPHPGEAARLLNKNTQTIQNDREASAQSLIKLTRAISVLKGHQTLVGSHDHPMQKCMEGNAGMATGGMGDVLTGLIAAIASQGITHNLSLWESTLLSVQIHAKAADRLVSKQIGPIGMTPSEIIPMIRTIINEGYISHLSI
jgi:hydroxyethylthiazole kinase-like uncharacterized protein yjeF